VCRYYIKDYIKEKHSYVPKTCWIADMKEICGLKPKMAASRISATKKEQPCPKEKQEDLRKAFEHFNMI